MLTEEIKKEILEYVNQARGRKQSACIDALAIVQRYKGWVSDDILREIADFLDLTPEELDSVATFYNRIFRKPVGRHVILLCDSVSCWILGHDSLVNHLQARLGIRLGDTTEDGRFTLLPVHCLGACDLAPAMMVDDDLHGDLNPGKVNEILETYK